MGYSGLRFLCLPCIYIVEVYWKCGAGEGFCKYCGQREKQGAKDIEYYTE